MLNICSGIHVAYSFSEAMYAFYATVDKTNVLVNYSNLLHKTSCIHFAVLCFLTLSHVDAAFSHVAIV